MRCIKYTRKRLDPVNHLCRWLLGAEFHVASKHKHKKRSHVIVHNLSWNDDMTIFSVLFREFDALGNSTSIFWSIFILTIIGRGWAYFHKPQSELPAYIESNVFVSRRYCSFTYHNQENSGLIYKAAAAADAQKVSRMLRVYHSLREICEPFIVVVSAALFSILRIKIWCFHSYLK